MKPTNTRINKLDQITFARYQTQLYQAAQTPWLAAVMLKRARLLSIRLNFFYQQLTSLPRRWRRRLQKLLAAGLVGAALLLAFGPTPSVHAATITIDPGASGIVLDGNCSLVEAIHNANDTTTGQPYVDCDPGNPAGADTINLAGNIYSYANPYGTSSALPNITSEITLEGDGSSVERSNVAPSYFRMIQVDGSGDLTLRQVTISGGNAASGLGGGLLNNGVLTVEESTISGNAANRGGGIQNNSGQLTLTNSTVSSNFAGSQGGGINNNGGTTIIENSLVDTNYASTGSGLSNYSGGVMTITDSVIRDNMTGNGYYGGAGLLNLNGDVAINSSTISGNNNAARGGAISNISLDYYTAISNATITINKSTISGNQANRTGGIFNLAGTFNGTQTGQATVTINDSTITGNSSNQPGGGLFNRSYGGGGLETAVINLHRSIVAGNSSSSGVNEIVHIASSGSIYADDMNFFSDSSQTNAQAFSNFTPGASDLTATSDGTNPTALSDILNATLSDNGGPTTPDGTILTHALVLNSPATDLIPTTDPNCNPGSSTDQRGADRANGPGAGGSACDSGAFELDYPVPGQIAVSPGAAGINNLDGCSLVEAIISANTDAAYSDCTAGSGPDTIYLGGNTYTYISAYGPTTALPTITSDITIEANGATIARDSGAANFRLMRVDNGGTLTLNEAMLTGGQASDSGLVHTRGGGALLNYGGTVTINNSTISGNSATGSLFNRGGGIRNNAQNGYSSTPIIATMTINTSTISGNTTSSVGGGISTESYNYLGSSATATLTINDSTITNNSSSNEGGGINLNSASFTGTANTTLDLSRTIIAGNYGSNHQEIHSVSGTVNAANYNLIGHSDYTNGESFNGFTPSGTDISATSDGNTPTSLTSILNKSAVNNGGPTFTVALSDVSIAIDAIPTTDPTCNPGSSEDQRGAGRASGFGQGGSACDIGAYEEAFSSPLSPTATEMLMAEIRQEIANPGFWAGLVGFAGIVSGFILGWLKRSESV